MPDVEKGKSKVTDVRPSIDVPVDFYWSLRVEHPDRLFFWAMYNPKSILLALFGYKDSCERLSSDQTDSESVNLELFL
jgi:hypothetical protein